jgi:undecaprenyl-diphosphatase
VVTAVQPAAAERPWPTRRVGWVGAGAAASIVLVLAVLIVRGWPPLLRCDESVDDTIHVWALTTPWAVRGSEVLQAAGSFAACVLVVAATTILLVVAHRWRAALALVAVASLAPWVTSLLKPVVGRARPVWEHSLGPEATLSYPSGHATAGIAVYAACGVALASLMRSRAWGLGVALAFGAFGVAMGLSRLVLGVHWPSDVLGGFCVALAVAGTAGALLVRPPAPSLAS